MFGWNPFGFFTLVFASVFHSLFGPYFLSQPAASKASQRPASQPAASKPASGQQASQRPAKPASGQQASQRPAKPASGQQKAL